MSDRICMMTNGPNATVGQILDLPFDWPRDRPALLNHPHYYDFRISLISFLEKHEKVKSSDKMLEPSDGELHLVEQDPSEQPDRETVGVS
jgi:hypothetical protein